MQVTFQIKLSQILLWHCQHPVSTLRVWALKRKRAMFRSTCLLSSSSRYLGNAWGGPRTLLGLRGKAIHAWWVASLWACVLGSAPSSSLHTARKRSRKSTTKSYRGRGVAALMQLAYVSAARRPSHASMNSAVQYFL